jgi:hypothetical protein
MKVFTTSQNNYKIANKHKIMERKGDIGLSENILIKPTFMINIMVKACHYKHLPFETNSKAVRSYSHLHKLHFSEINFNTYEVHPESKKSIVKDSGHAGDKHNSCEGQSSSVCQ